MVAADWHAAATPKHMKRLSLRKIQPDIGSRRALG
jgi:hypothetical protein